MYFVRATHCYIICRLIIISSIQNGSSDAKTRNTLHYALLNNNDKNIVEYSVRTQLFAILINYNNFLPLGFFDSFAKFPYTMWILLAVMEFVS